MAGFVFFHLSEKLFPDSPFKVHFLPHLCQVALVLLLMTLKGELIFGRDKNPLQIFCVFLLKSNNFEPHP